MSQRRKEQKELLFRRIKNYIRSLEYLCQLDQNLGFKSEERTNSWILIYKEHPQLVASIRRALKQYEFTDSEEDTQRFNTILEHYLINSRDELMAILVAKSPDYVEGEVDITAKETLPIEESIYCSNLPDIHLSLDLIPDVSLICKSSDTNYCQTCVSSENDIPENTLDNYLLNRDIDNTYTRKSDCNAVSAKLNAVVRYRSQKYRNNSFWLSHQLRNMPTRRVLIDPKHIGILNTEVEEPLVVRKSTTFPVVIYVPPGNNLHDVIVDSNEFCNGDDLFNIQYRPFCYSSMPYLLKHGRVSIMCLPSRTEFRSNCCFNGISSYQYYYDYLTSYIKYCDYVFHTNNIADVLDIRWLRQQL